MNHTAIIGYLSGIKQSSGAKFKNGRNKLELLLDVCIWTKPNFESTDEQKVLYEKWECSNHMIVIIMKGSITPTISGAISNSNNVMNYMKLVEEQFLKSVKSLESTLMIKIITLKYDGHSGVLAHYENE